MTALTHITKNTKHLIANRRKGVSLAIMMCIFALLLSLSLGLVHGASAALRRGADSIAEERCRQMALSFSDVLQQELTSPSFDSGSLSSYVNHCFSLWQTEGTAVFHIQELPTEDAASLSLTIEFLEESQQPTTGNFLYTQSDSALSSIQEDSNFMRFRFSVGISVSYRDKHYTCSDTYCRCDSFQPRFFCSGQELFPSGGVWYTDEACTAPFTPAESEDPLITYTYDPHNITAMVFVPAVEKGGETA